MAPALLEIHTNDQHLEVLVHRQFLDQQTSEKEIDRLSEIKELSQKYFSHNASIKTNLNSVTENMKKIKETKMKENIENPGNTVNMEDLELSMQMESDNTIGRTNKKNVQREDLIKTMSSSALSSTYSLPLSMSKIYSYNSGGQKHFQNSNYHMALKFYIRALRWSHRVEEIIANETVQSSQIRQMGSQSEEEFMDSFTPSSRSASYSELEAQCNNNDNMKKVSDNKENLEVKTLTNNQSSLIDDILQSKETLPLIITRTLINIATTYFARNQILKARDCYEHALSLLKSPPSSIPKNKPDILYIQDQLHAISTYEDSLKPILDIQSQAREYEIICNNYQDSLSLYQSSLSSLNKIIANTQVHPQISNALHKIGILYWKMGDYTKALSTLTKSLQIILQCFGEDCIDSIDILASIGKVHLARGEHNSSLKSYQAALQIVKHDASQCGSSFDDNANKCIVAQLMMNIGMVYAEDGQLQKSMDMYREGMMLQRKEISRLEQEMYSIQEEDYSEETQNHQRSEIYALKREKYVSLQLSLAGSLNAYGVLQEKHGEMNNAMHSYTEAFSLYKNGLIRGDLHVDIATTLNNIGQIFRHWCQYDKALEAYYKALKILKKIVGDSHRNVASILHNMGVVHGKLKMWDKGLELLKETLDLQRTVLGTEHLDVALTLQSMGELYEGQGDALQYSSAIRDVPRRNSLESTSLSKTKAKYQKAINLYKKALRIRRSALGPDHYYIALTQHKIARIYYINEVDVGSAYRRFKETVRIYRLNAIDESQPHMSEAICFMNNLYKDKRCRTASGNSSAGYSSGSSYKKSHSS